MSAVEPHLIGRAQGCAALDRILAAARTGSSARLVIKGEAGVGKTALLSYAQSAAADLTTLTITGNEFDRDVSFASLFDLLRPALGLIDSLPAPQRAALRGAFAMEPPTRGTQLSVGVAVLGLLSALAADSGLLVTIDDAQWLDPASADALGFVVRRLEAEGIAMVISERGITPSARFPDADEELLTGLDQPEVAELITALNVGERYSAAELVESTGGNPLAIREIAIGASSSFDVQLGAINSPIQTSPRLRRAFLEQVSQLPAKSRQALLFVAAAGPHDAAVLAAVLDAHGLDLRDLDVAEQANLLHARAGVLAYRHPLIQSAVYHSATKAEVRLVHRSFADALLAHDDPASMERRMTHLLLAGATPDEGLALELEGIGRYAAGRRNYVGAGDALETAAQLSTVTGNRGRRYLQAASFALAAGRISDALRLITDTFEWSADNSTRAAALHLAYRVGLWRGSPEQVNGHLLEVITAPETGAAEVSAILAEAALASLMLGERTNAKASAERAVRAADGLDGPDRLPGLLVQAFTQGLSGELDTARALVAEAEQWISSRPGEQWPLIAALIYFLLDELVEAARRIEDFIAGIRHAGAVELLPVPLLTQARIELRRGRWSGAVASAREAAGLIESLGGPNSEVGNLFAPDSSAVLALIAALVGNDDDCRLAARTSLDFGIVTGNDMLVGHGHRALGLLELGARNFDAAAAQFEALDNLNTIRGLLDTPFLPWLADLVESQLGANRSDAARVTLRRLCDLAELAPTIANRALRDRCLTLLSESPDPGMLRDSGDRLMTSHIPFEAARSHLYAGELHRRRKEAGPARILLTSAFDTFGALGANPWRDRAGQELRALGVRPPDAAARPAGLTPQEFQIASFAAEGKSNREIASQLFLSQKTIEFHLANTYRKLGIRRRSQLAPLMASPTGPEPTL